MSAVVAPGTRHSRERIRRELAGVPMTAAEWRAARIASFGPEWVDTREAARMLGCSPLTLLKIKALERRAASQQATCARSVGALYLRADIERLAEIRKRCRLRFADAARVLETLKKDGPL